MSDLWNRIVSATRTKTKDARQRIWRVQSRLIFKKDVRRFHVRAQKYIQFRLNIIDVWRVSSDT